MATHVLLPCWSHHPNSLVARINTNVEKPKRTHLLFNGSYEVTIFPPARSAFEWRLRWTAFYNTSKQIKMSYRMLEIKRVSDETIAHAVSWLHRQQASWRFLLAEESCAWSSCADRRGHNEPLCSFMEKTVLTTVFESNLYVPRKSACLDTVAAWFGLELHSWDVKQEKLNLFCKVLEVCRLALGPLGKG